MFFRRSFSTGIHGNSVRLWLQDNSGPILALGVIGGSSFAAGLYINQLKVFEEKLKTIQLEARKDVENTLMVARKDVENALMVARKDVENALMVARKDVENAYEKIKTTQIEARKDVENARMEASKETLERLFALVSQQEYKKAKKNVLNPELKESAEKVVADPD